MPLPSAPTKLMVSIDVGQQLSVLHWDPVTTDINGDPAVATGYKVYVAYQANLKDIALLGTVTTLDIDGNVDTLYIDNDVSLTDNAYYQVSALSVDGESERSELGFDLVELKYHG